jgi:heterodisulfide reductase subunit A-like polyferredoxin
LQYITDISLKILCGTIKKKKLFLIPASLDHEHTCCHAGHNGLVAAAYLQKSGIQTCVLEKRHVVGGAAVTEEIVPGFKFSRASYLLSLLRPHIYSDLELKVCICL